MTVFKGYMAMTKKNIGIALMYLGIFLGIALAINAVLQKEGSGGFSAKKVDVAIVDLDKSELSKNLITYLQKKHYVTLEEDDKSKLSEELYYGGQGVVLRIQKGFEEKALLGKVGVNLTNSPGQYKGMYLEQQINCFLRNVMTYHAMGYSVAESCQKVQKQKESKVLIEDLNGNGGKTPAYAGFFQYLPYLFIAVFGEVLGKILFIFRKREVKNRLMASAVSLTRQTGETILAFFAVGAGMYLICNIIALLLYGDSIQNAGNFGWYVLNGFINMLAALEIAFIIGISVKKEMQVNTVTVPVSLGLCFLGGVFVPLNIMAPQVKAVSKFLPMYWYETVNNLLIDYEDISGVVRKQVLTGMGIQMLFLFALAGIGIAIVKYQQQER